MTGNGHQAPTAHSRTRLRGDDLRRLLLRGQPRALLTTSTWMCAALFIFYRLDATYEWIGLLVLLKVVLGLSHIFALLL